MAVPLALLSGDPKVRVVAVDVNAHALRLLRERAPDARRVDCVAADAAALDVDAECVVSLHACGAVSDVALDLALDARVPFAISPCCLGKGLADRDPGSRGGRMPRAADQRSARPPSVTYPRSAWLSSRLETPKLDYALLAAAADYGVGDADADDVARVQRRAKRVVEHDRLMSAVERAGFAVTLVDLHTVTHDPRYPKRELLLGAPAGSRAAIAISKLPTSPPRFAS